MSSSSSFDYESQTSGRSLSELFTEMTSDLSTLFRQELDLAKAELRQEASKAGQAAAMIAAAAIFGLLTLILVAFAAAWGLAEVMPAGWAFLVVGVVVGIVAAVLGAMGRKRLQQVQPRPDMTIETLKEDAQTIKERRP